MKNMELYEKVRSVDETAKKEIKGGRLQGMTDINPMWRIKTLTEIFGPCGIGWKPVVTKKEIVEGSAGQMSAFVDIDLYVKYNGEWSEAIPGMGGAAFVTNEKNGPYTSDECYKMAYTDAISVACKLLGFGADVYWAKDRTKYDTHQDDVSLDVVKTAISEMVSKLGSADEMYAVLRMTKDSMRQSLSTPNGRAELLNIIQAEALKP